MIKLFGPGGIDEKSNDLLRDPRMLRGGKNIRYNDRKEYVKRNGTEVDDSSPVSTTDNEDMIYIRSMDTYFYYDGTNYIDTKRGIVYDFNSPVRPTSSKKLCATEVLGSLIFTHVDDPFSVLKYDGQSVFRAGMPAPTWDSYTNVIGSGTKVPFMLFYYSYIDINSGAEVNGPYLTIKNPTVVYIPSSQDTARLSLYTSNLDGFKKSFLEISSSQNAIYSASAPTISFTNCSEDLRDIQEGFKIPVRTSYSDVASNSSIIVSVPNLEVLNPLILEVESVVYGTPSGSKYPVTITFKPSSFGDHRVLTFCSSGSFQNFHCGTTLKFWYSNSEFTGYRGFSPITSGNIGVCNLSLWLTSPTWGIRYMVRPPSSSDFDYVGLSAGNILSLEYDITTSKLRPPACKYVKAYGYQLICANVIGFWDFRNSLNSYDNDDLLTYSDLSSGDTPESFTESNRQLIGETHDGFLSGLARLEDSLIVFKNRGIFAIDGVLLPGQYSIRKIFSDDRGTEAFKSILETDRGVFFQAKDGIYVTNSYEVSEASEGLHESMKLVDPLSCRSIVNPNDKEYLFYLRSKDQVGGEYRHFFFVVNYDHNEVFWWEGIDASAGLTISNGGQVYFFGEDDVTRKMILQKRDKHPSDPLLDSAISSYVRTAWLDMGEPSLLKKMIGYRLFCLNNQGQTITSTLSWDWGAKADKPPITIDDFSSATVKTKNQKIPIQQAQSISLEFSNDVIDEDMNISGYEIEMNIIQNKDKNVK